ncbi:MAG: rhodanese-like domain-containing protein [Proteobacteria bacterium]|nr:rhodanese-like domain-containing protein [Pseudomonadota bacterium]
MTTKSAKELVAAANAEIETLAADAAVKLMNDANVVFVDVRDGDERRKAGALQGAVHVSRGILEFHADPTSPMHNKALGGGKRLLLYCASGGRSALAAQTLKSMGITNVAHVAGGFPALQAAGGKIEPIT